LVAEDIEVEHVKDFEAGLNGGRLRFRLGGWVQGLFGGGWRGRCLCKIFLSVVLFGVKTRIELEKTAS
jgi:hypothetical protein